MAKRIFISFQHNDRMKAKGFNLLRYSKYVDVEFVGRHLLDPVNSSNESYIRSKIMDQLNGTSVTVVLVGKETHNSEWVKWEIEKSLEKKSPNGILAIRLGDDVKLPDGSPVGDALKEAGAEIMDWKPHEFESAIERAFAAAGRIPKVRTATQTGRSCQR